MRFLRLWTAAASAALAFFGLLETVEAEVGRWTSNGPFAGAAVTALVVDPTATQTAYAGTPRGVFWTIDGGVHWQRAAEGLPDNPPFWVEITALAIDPITTSTLYAGTERKGLFRSVDSGASWLKIAELAPPFDGIPARVNQIVVDPRDPSVVFAATARGLYRSIDRGESWSTTSLRLDNVVALVIDPSNGDHLWAGTAGDGDNLFRSTDRGSTWTGRDIPPDAFSYSPVGGSITALAIDPTNPSVLYAGESTGIFKSGDDGATWSRSGYDGGVSCLLFDPARSDTLYACDYGHILKTEDAGASWSVIFAGNGGSAALAIDPVHPEVIYLGSGGLGGVLKTMDGGRTFTAMDEGMNTSRVMSVETDPTAPTRIYTGLSESQAPLWKSVEGGDRWTPSSLGLTLHSVPAIVSTPSADILYAASGFGILKSVDQGETWTGDEFQLAPTAISTLAVDPRNLNLVYAGTFCCTTRATVVGGVYRSNDHGRTWFFSAVGLSPDAARGIDSLVVSPENGVVFAGTGAGVFQSTNGGISWVPSGLSGIRISSLRFDPHAASTVYAASYGEGIFKSTNRGVTWSPINDGLTNRDVFAIAVDPARRGTVYAGTYGGGVFRTTDGGGLWYSFSDELSNLYVTSLAVDSSGTSIHAGTWGGGVFDLTFLPDRPVISMVPRRPPPRTLDPRN